MGGLEGRPALRRLRDRRRDRARRHLPVLPVAAQPAGRPAEAEAPPRPDPGPGRAAAGVLVRARRGGAGAAGAGGGRGRAARRVAGGAGARLPGRGVGDPAAALGAARRHPPARRRRSLRRSASRSKGGAHAFRVGARAWWPGPFCCSRPSGAERRARSRWTAGPADGAWLGLAQAAALWPGVSRNGATLAVARWRGFARDGGQPAVARGRRPGHARRRRPACGASGVMTPATRWRRRSRARSRRLPAMRWVDRGGPLWPFAAERAGLALLLLRHSRA